MSLFFVEFFHLLKCEHVFVEISQFLNTYSLSMSIIYAKVASCIIYDIKAVLHIVDINIRNVFL